MSIEWWAEQTASPGSCWHLSIFKSGNGSAQVQSRTAGPLCLRPEQSKAAPRGRGAIPLDLKLLKILRGKSVEDHISLQHMFLSGI